MSVLLCGRYQMNNNGKLFFVNGMVVSKFRPYFGSVAATFFHFFYLLVARSSEVQIYIYLRITSTLTQKRYDIEMGIFSVPSKNCVSFFHPVRRTCCQRVYSKRGEPLARAFFRPDFGSFFVIPGER